MSNELKTLQVGLVMPISAIENCSAEHWLEVSTIFTDAVNSISQYKCDVRIVSDADEIGVIQKRIVQNLYSSDIVICDVSCKNANVMFELGMRLAFDKPVILVKDDQTSYTFDTNMIEHMEYPRDLRFSKIVDFKTKLARKVVATYEHYSANPDQSTFLKNFGEFKVAKLTETTVTSDRFIHEMLIEIQSDIAFLKQEKRTRTTDSNDKIYQEQIAVELYRFLKFKNISDPEHLTSDLLFELCERIINTVFRKYKIKLTQEEVAQRVTTLLKHGIPKLNLTLF